MAKPAQTDAAVREQVQAILGAADLTNAQKQVAIEVVLAGGTVDTSQLRSHAAMPGLPIGRSDLAIQRGGTGHAWMPGIEIGGGDRQQAPMPPLRIARTKAAPAVSSAHHGSGHAPMPGLTIGPGAR